MTDFDMGEIIRQAKAEVAAEDRKMLVEKHKEKIRLRQSFWVRIFPWRLRIERRDRPTETQELKARNTDLHEHCAWQYDQMQKMKLLMELERRQHNARYQ
jgi:hypothetical protein